VNRASFALLASLGGWERSDHNGTGGANRLRMGAKARLLGQNPKTALVQS
jgi:hypothetical protein